MYYFKEAVRVDPSYKSTYNEIGLFYTDKKKEDSAIVYFKKALAVDSNYHYPLSTNDSDLEPLRTTTKFKQLMQQYFPAKQ